VGDLVAGRGKNLQEKENKAMYDACHLRGINKRGRVEDRWRSTGLKNH
jgi:hypothetical protein